MKGFSEKHRVHYIRYLRFYTERKGIILHRKYIYNEENCTDEQTSIDKSHLINETIYTSILLTRLCNNSFPNN